MSKIPALSSSTMPERIQSSPNKAALMCPETATHLLRYIDVAATAMGRATFYNTREEQEQTEKSIHEALFACDRGLYGLMAGLPGTSDRSLQQIVQHLLRHPRQPDGAALLTEQEELRLLEWICQTLPVTRMLKLFVALKEQRVNNTRTRKLILRMLLANKRLSMWCTRYRKKLQVSLKHAWGQRTSGILRAILSKPASTHDDKEQMLLRRHILRYTGTQDPKRVLDCAAFLLGVQKDFQDKRLRAFYEARHDLEAGRALPYETLEGIRSTYHKDQPSSAVLTLTQHQLTDGQKLGLQKTAREAQVDVALDLSRYDAVRLYLYAMNQGLEPRMREILQQKARENAADFPLSLGRVGILLDASLSMHGDSSQALRPMATCLALRDMLTAAAQDVALEVCGGTPEAEGLWFRPAGETSLARGLIKLLQGEPDAIFILSDGYENAPAGRVDEVLQQARKLGIQIPVYQLSPVLASESGGVRALSTDAATALPARDPRQMALPFLKAMLAQEPDQALPLLCQELWKGLQRRLKLAPSTSAQATEKNKAPLGGLPC